MFLYKNVNFMQWQVQDSKKGGLKLQRKIISIIIYTVISAV